MKRTKRNFTHKLLLDGACACGLEIEYQDYEVKLTGDGERPTCPDCIATVEGVNGVLPCGCTVKDAENGCECEDCDTGNNCDAYRMAKDHA